MKRKYIWPILSIFLMILLFLLSSQNGSQSTKVSDIVVNPLSIFHIKNLEYLVRKSFHFGIYAILGLCIYKTFETHRYSIILSILICFLYASSDEIHQLFVPGRSGEFHDVFIDTCGACLGICIIYFITILKRRSIS